LKTLLKEILHLNRFSSNKLLQKVLLFLLVLLSFCTNGQLVVNGNITNAALITDLFGPGVKVTNLVVNCDTGQYGSFNAAGTGLGVNNGILMTNGSVYGAIGPNDTTMISSTCVGTSSSDACIGTIASGTQHDPCIITFDIIPNCDTMQMNYVFASEEYPDFVGQYDDAFGFFINGPKPGGGTYNCTDVALIPGSTTPVSINTVNDGTNPGYFRVNTVPTSPTYNSIKYNGLTVPLVAVIPVIPCQTYHMEIAIVDIGDCFYDSGVFLQYQGMHCAADQTLTVTPKDTSFCTAKPVTLTASGSGTYTWSPAAGLNTTTGPVVIATPTATTQYIVSAATACGTETDTVTITIGGKSVMKVNTTFKSNSCTACNSSAGVTSVTGGSGGPFTYTWLPGNMTTQTVNGLCTGTYSVIVHDNGTSCTAPDDTTIIIIGSSTALKAQFTADTLSGCSPVCVRFTDFSTITSGAIKNWLWDFGDGATSNLQNPKHCFTGAGTYTINLQITSDSGCNANLSVPQMINVYSHPNAMFTESPERTTILNPTVQYIDKTIDSYGISKWFWVFNNPDESVSFDEDPTITYTDTGTYCATMLVINKQGCADSISGCIDVQPLYTFYIPSAFSPNNDGLNDVFLPKGSYICGFDMYIFDRWGQQLYHTTNIDKGWNGKTGSGSNPIEEDTYIYLINTTDCVNHANHEYIGNINVIK
jgi:gliding motility-associated-like protein